MTTIKRKSKGKQIFAAICLAIIAFTGSITILFVGENFQNSTASTTIIDLSEEFDSRVLPVCERQRLGHQGGVAVGDINGDGVNDLVLAAYNATVKNDGIKIDNLYFRRNKRVSLGSVYVFYGPISGLYSTFDADITIVGTPGDRNFGEYLSVGDVNNDTYDDIIVGSPLNEFNFGSHQEKELKFFSDGKVEVFFGGPQLDNFIADDNYTIYSKNKSLLGFHIITKDINDDFVDDLIFGAPYADGKSNDSSYNCGEIYVIFGSSKLSGRIDLNDSEPDITIIGKDKGDSLGWQRTFDVGDIYCDGVKDLVIGVTEGDSRANTRINAGEVYIINNISSYNGIMDLNEINITTTVYGAEAGDSLGKLTVSDFNNDEVDDVLMGAPWADGVDNSRKNSGEVYIIYGRHDLSSIKDLNLSDVDVRIIGADSGDRLGDVLTSGNATAIVLGSDGGDGPYNNKTGCGEANIIFNNKNIPGLIDLRTYPSDIIVYGADRRDKLRDLYVGDVSGDNSPDLIIGLRDADGFNNKRKEGGEVFVINDAFPNSCTTKNKKSQ